MKALILGGTGFIGSHISVQLAKLNQDVRVYSPSAKRFSFTENITCVNGFIADKGELKKHVEWADVVLHFVSTTNPKTSMVDHYHDLDSNLLPFVQLLEMVKEYKEKKIVFCSSGGAVYGKAADHPIKETDIKQPSTSYGLVKSLMEEYIMYYHRKFAIPFLILRPANVYGPKTRSVGEQGIISTLLYNAVHDQSTRLWVPLTNTRDFIYIDDFTEAVIDLLDAQAEGVFNIGSGKGFSLSQIIRAVQLCTDKDLKIEMAHEFVEDEGINILDNSKIHSLTGWMPQVSINAGIANVYQQMLSSIKENELLNL
ncbi:MAG: NAD-dependent epimerase/dehydratase family protein [Chitinophagaceae bacterium]|nr:NAD-dependent epimerase/dehydratase family protein [Chitinophagaceae bacterium]